MPHQRRKSGGYATTTVENRKAVCANDVRYTSRPAMPRRYTPSTPSTPSRTTKTSRSRRDVWEVEPESFPQFCMICEKQFVPHDDKFIYCSDACRRVDQVSSSSSSTTSAFHSYSDSRDSYGYPAYASDYYQEPRDIIPQASPSRPESTIYSSSPSYPSQHYSHHHHNHHESAVSALRSSLSSAALARPASPTSSSPSTQSGIWPFRRGSVAPTSPMGSYHKSSYNYLSSSHLDGGNYHGYHASERPLPSRQPAGYARPKSIELVTPIIGR